MTDQERNETITRAEVARKEACDSLARVINAAYPIGTRVCVHWNRATFTAEVVRHMPAWSSTLGRIKVRNIGTGKEREIPVSAIQWTITNREG